MNAELQRQIETLPEQPGVYLFADGRGKVIYVGKAKRVRARVRQYLTGHDERLLVPKLVRAAASVEAVVTSTEKEALILENSLIKKYQPRYNIQLRDDKNFLHLRLDNKGPWPRYTLVRRIERDIQKKRTGEMASVNLGEILMKHLRGFDKVAYIRFASVYYSFEDLEMFEEELKKLSRKRRKK